MGATGIREGHENEVYNGCEKAYLKSPECRKQRREGCES